MFINVYRENPERDFEVVRAVAAAIIGQLDTLSPYILLMYMYMYFSTCIHVYSVCILVQLSKYIHNYICIHVILLFAG